MVELKDLKVGMFAEWDNYPERMYVVKVVEVSQRRGMVRVRTLTKGPYNKPLYDQWVQPSTVHNPHVPDPRKGKGVEQRDG